MIRHTPMIPLEGTRGKLIGYLCGHCDGIWTANMTPSLPQKPLNHNPGFTPIYRKNKAHALRQAAVRKAKKKLAKKSE